MACYYAQRSGIQNADAEEIAEKGIQRLITWCKKNPSVAPSNFLFATMIRALSVDTLRRHTRQNRHLRTYALNVGVEPPSPIDVLIKTEDLNKLQCVLDSLPKQHAILIRLTYWARRSDGKPLSNRTIAAAMGYSESWVRQTHKKVLAEMAEQMNRLGTEEASAED